jgi:flavin-dependent dehydrogenase
MDQFLAESCPEAKKEVRWAGLLPMARDPSLWNTPCVGPGWAVLGDAAGHVHPLTGEGIIYALWSAELLAEAFRQGEPGAYDVLWRQEYGNGFAGASEILATLGSDGGVYELSFQLTMAMALLR